MSEGFSFSWNELSGPTSGVATVKFPRRLVRAIVPSVRGRILSWSGTTIFAVAMPELLQMMQPNILLGMSVGGNVTRRLCGLTGKVFIPPGVGVELALDSPRFALSTQAKAAWFYRFVPGRCDFQLSESEAGSLVDNVSLCIPVINDNDSGAGDNYSYSAVSFEQVSGYSRYELTNGTSSALHMLARGMAAPWRGTVEQGNFSAEQSTDTIGNDLLSGYAALAYQGTGYPMQVLNQAAGYTGAPNVWQAGTLSFF